MNEFVESIRVALADDPAGKPPTLTPKYHTDHDGNQLLVNHSWPVRVAGYLAHVVLSLPQRKAGEMVGRSARVVREGCAQVEDHRDDPRFDALMDRLSAQTLAAYA